MSCEELHHSCRVADRRAPGAVLFTIAERAQYIISNSDQIIIGSDTGWFDPGFPPGFEIEEVDGRWTMVGDLAQDYRSVPEAWEVGPR